MRDNRRQHQGEPTSLRLVLTPVVSHRVGRRAANGIDDGQPLRVEFLYAPCPCASVVRWPTYPGWGIPKLPRGIALRNIETSPEDQEFSCSFNLLLKVCFSSRKHLEDCVGVIDRPAPCAPLISCSAAQMRVSSGSDTSAARSGRGGRTPRTVSPLRSSARGSFRRPGSPILRASADRSRSG